MPEEIPPQTSPDRTYRAEQSAMVMGHPLVVEAFETIERELKDLWAASSERDTEGRERAFTMMWACRRFKSFFQNVMDEGKLHKWQLDQLKRGQL